MFKFNLNYRRAISLLIFASLSLRLLCAVSLGDNLIWPDARTNNQIAINIKNGNGFTLNNAQVPVDPPGFPYYLAFFYYAFGKNILIFRSLQAIILSLITLVVYQLSAMLFDHACGLISAILVTIYPYYIYISVQILPTGFFTLLLATAILFQFKNLKTQNYVYALITGTLYGLATLTVVPMTAFLPCIFVIYAVYPNMQLKRRLLNCGLVLICCILTISPWILRNYLIHHELYLISRSGPSAFLQGNWPDASPDHGKNKAYNIQDLIDSDEIKVYDGLGSIQRQEMLKEKLIQYIIENPAWFARHYILKAINFYRFYPHTLTGVGNNKLIKLISIFSYGPVFCLALIGIFVSRQRWKELIPLYLLFLSFTFGYALFLTNVRYRLPLDLYLIMFSSFAIVNLKPNKVLSHFQSNC